MRWFLDLLFPARCVACGASAPGLCGACRPALHRAPPQPPPPGIAWWVSPFAYDGAAREVLARLKYRNTRAALPWLALEVAAAVRAGSPRRLPDVVTWAPTTRTRRRGRGYDQGELLARAVAARLRIPARALLVRESGVAQTGRTRMARWSSPPRFRPVGPLARALTVLVIDDVATTGATLAAAAHALTEAGAARVVGATAARTPRAAHTVLPASTRAQARGE